jgi:UDP-N-acetylmuramate--alanine ligase
MRIGIFFGGLSREREISFAGGRTVYDNLNKNLFEAVPIFVDSVGNFIQLDWSYMYKGTIRDFYPPVAFLPESNPPFQVYVESLGQLSEEQTNALCNSVGKRIQPSDFKNIFDIAFLALHGPYGEDGNIQGILEWYGLPYTGSGILPSAIGISKTAQQDLMRQAGFNRPKNAVIGKKDFFEGNPSAIFEQLKKELGFPFVVKSPNQGSSLGVTILKNDSVEEFIKAAYKSFFILKIEKSEWLSYTDEQKYVLVRDMADIRVGIGLPVKVGEKVFYHPADVLNFINEYFETPPKSSPEGRTTPLSFGEGSGVRSETPSPLGKVGMGLLIESIDTEEELLLEQMIKGKEFSCIVVEDEKGKTIALPPTEIVKGTDLFDYRSKYLPGMSRKVTPINLPDAQIENIRKECEKLYDALRFDVYARIDGFITDNGEVFLNDPNTTSGMMPSSFFFHQAAEIGLNPSQFLTYLIRTSLLARIKSGKNSFKIKQLLSQFDKNLSNLNAQKVEKRKVAVIMGGYSSERHISVESGRNIFEKLASSTKYEPIPVFLTGGDNDHHLYEMPINVMLKDNADDIKEKVESENYEKHPVIKKIISEAATITKRFAQNALFEPVKLDYDTLAKRVDAVFIALHGRPGEDGQLQKELDKRGIPYNGSGVESSATTINKFLTNKILRENGVLVANHKLVTQEEWVKNPAALVAEIEKEFKYPIIAKPSDDGCSSAVKKIKTTEQLIAFANMMFRATPEFLTKESEVLGLKYKEEFPQKAYFLIEDLISKNDAKHFLEVTGGMLTKTVNGVRTYEVFEPSETLASGEVLSLEEKFLAGEGQNITPARYSMSKESQAKVSAQVRAELEKTARILNVEGYCRIDAFVRVFDNDRAETIVIEINSLPGMTPATCIFHQCAINGYKPYEFIDAILEYGRNKGKV